MDNIETSQRNLRIQTASQGASAILSAHSNEEGDAHGIKLDKVPLMLSPGIESIK